MRNRYKSRRKFFKRAGTIFIGSTLLSASKFRNILLPKNQWKSEPRLPFKLQEIYCAVVKNKIHVAGGFIDNNGTLGVSSHHVVFDPALNKWAINTPLPEARHHPQLINHHDVLYVLGGYVAEGSTGSWVAQSQMWKYNEEEEIWKELSSAPTKNGESVSASIDDQIHIVGGRHPKGLSNKTYQDKEDVDTHLIYHPASDTWDFGAPALKKRNSATGAVINGLFYIAGGRTMQGGNVPDLEIYDPKEDKWRRAAPMPQGQGGLAGAALNGKLYVFGGEFFNNGSGVYSESWCYDPDKDQWDSAEPMKTPRHGLCAATVHKRIYTIGGAKKASASETSDIVESIAYL